MSRFINLEFDGESDEQARGRTQEKDESFYLGEARAAFENGTFEAALRFYSKVLEFNPADVQAWAGQVRMLIELGEFKEARLWADKALERFPEDPELLAAKAVALARGGDLEEAMACSDASLQARGDGPYLWLARGDVLLARKEHRADFCFEKALILAPRDWVVAWLAARVRHYYGQFASALKLLEQALQWNGGHFLLWLELGRCQHALGLITAARTSLSQARELNPQSPDVAAALERLAHCGVWSRLRGWLRTMPGK
jgi:tetratricopeptide (TPR) repeat protein